MSMTVPDARTAEVHVLFTGYVGGRVASTVTYVRDGEMHVIVDPGMVPSPEDILRPLAQAGVAPDAVSDVIFSHHHPDHTLNAALFPQARFHDHWAIYQHDSWTSRPADGHAVTASIRLVATPGHTAEDITTLIGTRDGLVACTHLWWSESGPADDPLAEDLQGIHRWRGEVLALPELRLIIPGHGAPFVPTAQTVR
jgi:glyoxylase-like metal-dependent hydrolase (beta-lactamase superfamily II)